MMPIDPPRLHGPYPDRLIDCEAALESSVQQLIDAATAVGWTSAEMRKAIRRLIADHKRAEEEEAKLETHLAILRAMERARP
jgi:uncharacterized protein (UPF0335 family)